MSNSNREPRVLCFAPYGAWTLHALWEATLIHGIRARGASVETLTCDGLMRECDMHWGSTAPRGEDSCRRCQSLVAQQHHSLGVPYRWLGRYSLPCDRAEAERWADGMSGAELLRAHYGDWEIGQWTRSSVHTHFRRSFLDGNDAEVRTILHRYATSGVELALALTRAFDDIEPDILLQISGRFAPVRIALELARRRGVRVVCHERGLRAASITLWPDTHCHDLELPRTVCREWAEVPLTADELASTDGWLRERAGGGDLSWKPLSPAPQREADVRKALSLRSDAPVWVMFTSSDDESAGTRGYRGHFARQSDWMAASLAFARTRPEIQLVVRVHPNVSGPRSTGENRQHLDDVRRLAESAPKNARFVWPGDEVSSYTLAALADVGLVYQSTIALEMACLGRPVVVAIPSYWFDQPFVVTVRDEASYPATLASLADTRHERVDPAIRRAAYRCAHTLFFRWNVEFPLVETPDPDTGRLAYQSIDALAPGRDAALDRAVGVVLDGRSPCPAPLPAERARDDGAERAFFSSMETSKHVTSTQNRPREEAPNAL